MLDHKTGWIMLTGGHKQAGVSLVEILVGLVVMGILLAVAVPNFRAWIQNAQIRTAAEAIQDGLQVALSHAVTLNNPVQFALTGADSSWAVGCATATATCPGLIQSHSGVEGAPNAAVAAIQANVAFNGLGRIVPTPPAPLTFSVTNPQAGGACVPAGPMRCLNVQVTASGNIRICDPALPGYPTDPQGC